MALGSGAKGSDAQVPRPPILPLALQPAIQIGMPLIAASVALVREKDILLIARNRPPSEGLWTFPGGRLEPGETPEQCATRELKEEMGLDVFALRPLRRLTYGWQPRDGRSLFCVGDAMQSIYGFRAADVSLFLHVKAHGLGDVYLEPLQLTANFRSAPSLVHWVNRVFSKAFPDVSDIASGAVAYSLAEPFRPDQAAQVHYFSQAPGLGQAAEAERLYAEREG